MKGVERENKRFVSHKLKSKSSVSCRLFLLLLLVLAALILDLAGGEAKKWDGKGDR